MPGASNDKLDVLINNTGFIEQSSFNFVIAGWSCRNDAPKAMVEVIFLEAGNAGKNCPGVSGHQSIPGCGVRWFIIRTCPRRLILPL